MAKKRIVAIFDSNAWKLYGNWYANCSMKRILKTDTAFRFPLRNPSLSPVMLSRKMPPNRQVRQAKNPTRSSVE